MPDAEPHYDHASTLSSNNPFPGLRAFNPKEHDLYFGRGKQTAELLRRLRTARFLAVVGGSGSGKSSLVRAGLVPALHGGFMAGAGSKWRVAILRPGASPIANLAAALSDPKVLGETEEPGETAALIETTLRGSSLGLVESVRVARIPERDNVLVVVDQFEELFRFKSAAQSAAARDEAVAFVKLLLAATEHDVHLYVVLTMRSDFIGDCMEFPGLPETINEGQYLVPRMTRAELREVITGPVGVRDGKISPRLVARLLNEVGDNPDQLPVLQHALMRMWSHWELGGRNGALDLEHYQAIGTLKNALSEHAEKAYADLPDERHREIAERLFKALTETEGDARGIRRPARLDEICAIAGAEDEVDKVVGVIDRFRMIGRSFLMPPIWRALDGNSVIDLSHESLMRNWQRLVRWTEEEAGSARLYRRLADAARLHEAGEAGLWRAPELDLGLHWRQENQPTAAWARRYDPEFERAIGFLEKCEQARLKYQHSLEIQRRQKARRRGWLAGIAALMLLISGFTWYEMREKDRLRAVSAALNVDDPLLRAQVLAEMPQPLHLAGLLGRSERPAGGLEFEAVRRAAYDLIPVSVLATGEGPITATAISADGDWVASGHQGGEVELWPILRTHEARLLEHDGGKAHGADVVAIAFQPAGDRLITSSIDGSVRLWQRDDGRELAQLESGGAVNAVAFSPDGSRAVTAGVDGAARIFSAEGRLLIELPHPQPVAVAVFDATGSRMLTAAGRQARIWRLSEPPEVTVLEHDFDVHSASFSPDGRVMTADIQAVRIWSPDGKLARKLEHRSMTAATLSADGTWIATASHDGTARLWRLDGPAADAIVLRGHKSGVLNASFGPRVGQRTLVVTYSRDATARLWDLQGEPLYTLRGHVGALTAASFAPGASRPMLVTAAEDGFSRVWPLEPQEPAIIGRFGERVLALEPDPLWPRASALRAITVGRDLSVGVRSLDSSGAWALAEPGKQTEKVTSAAIGATGDSIITGQANGLARVWRRSPEANGAWSSTELAGHTDQVTSASFAEGCDLAITTSRDKTARIWQVASGETVAVLEGAKLSVDDAAISPDCQSAATASEDGSARIWRRSEAGDWQQEDPRRDRLVHPGRASVVSVDFHPQGDRILTAWGARAGVWRADPEGNWSDQPEIELRGHLDGVRNAVFVGTRGETALTYSKDGTVRVWNTATGTELYALEGANDVVAASVSQDGSQIVTVERDSTMRRWRVTLPGLQQYLRAATTACLSEANRRLLLGELAFVARSKLEKCEQRQSLPAIPAAPSSPPSGS